MNTETEKWSRFWFEGNQYFTWVNTRDEWNDLLDIYRPHCPTDDVAAWILDTAKVDASAEYTKYGFSIECNGAETLRQFFERNGMQP